MWSRQRHATQEGGSPPHFFFLIANRSWESIPGTPIAVVSIASLGKSGSAEPRLIAACLEASRPGKVSSILVNRPTPQALVRTLNGLCLESEGHKSGTQPRVCPRSWRSPSWNVRPVGRDSALHRREKTFPNEALTVALPMSTVRVFYCLGRWQAQRRYGTSPIDALTAGMHRGKLGSGSSFRGSGGEHRGQYFRVRRQDSLRCLAQTRGTRGRSCHHPPRQAGGQDRAGGDGRWC